MNVPVKVPADVPGAGSPPARPKRPRASRKRDDGTVPHLTRSGDGWRFQMRVPARLAADFALARVTPIIRGAFGPRGRDEARRLARRCAASCDAIFALAMAHKEAVAVLGESSNDQPNQLVHQVVDACQNMIKSAVAQPKTAIHLAHVLTGSLSTLQLVQSEVAKGQVGAAAIVRHAEELTRGALTDVIKHASDPNRALEVLSTTSDIHPSLMSTTAFTAPSTTVGTPPAPRSKRGEGVMPKFSEVSRSYIDMRIKNDGADHPDISALEMRRQTFIDVVGDFAVDEYYPSHMQDYVTAMQWWPPNVAKRAEMNGKSTKEILAESQKLGLPAMALKTMKDGFVTNIRTMMRHGMADYRYRDPFSGLKLTWPKRYRRSKPREELGPALINRVFHSGIASGLLDEALLPALAKLTSRRIGLLVYLRGSDIREKHGVMVAQTDGIVQAPDGRWTRVPYKTTESLTFFVLHNFWVEIGFVDWAMKRDGWIFEIAHEHPDPAKYESKAMSRLLKRNGAKQGREVFHNLRGEAIGDMRDAEVQNRATRLQAGHELGDEHERYGFRALKAAECRRLANLPLPEGIDWSAFKGLDFDAMAARRRKLGRRPG